MKPLTVITTYTPGPWLEKTLPPLATSELIEEILIIYPEPIDVTLPKSRVVTGGSLQSQRTIAQIITEANTKYLLFLPGSKRIVIESGALEKLVAKAESTKAGTVFSDYYEEGGQGRVFHPLNDYQVGSVRDDFDFGEIMLFSVPALRDILEKFGAMPGVQFAGLYDLRLKMSIEYPVYHMPEPLYSVISPGEPSGDTKLFTYVDPRNTDIQKEMEVVFTEYLKRIGAYLSPELLRHAEQTTDIFPVEASVVIPVRNRCGTIADAVKSAISQEADFPFNVIVVDNHSTDGTTGILSELARRNQALRHIVPKRTDLGIGGCWNEAINQQAIGRYAIQLDSDDLYSSPGTLQKIVDKIRQGPYAMVIGSYTLVNSRQEEIPPGLIDHSEWSDGNGHNNALRVNGLGAPRAFNTSIIRKIGFLNVSYGEDYAAALGICREYRIGRIYESIYLCRRWEGNTDAALTVEEANRNNAFKDSLRTKEILARQEMNRGVNT